MISTDRKVILITGASGYAGAGLYQSLKAAGLEVYGTYFSTKIFPELIHCDLTDQSQVVALFSKMKPDVVIHTAANASNGTCEEDPEGAIDLNVNATKYLVEEAQKSNAKMIFISTFGAYNPRGIYGESKVQAEKIVEELAEYMILRPSLIIGWSPNTQNDRPFNRFLRDLEQDKKIVEYDTSWEFNVTFLSHLASVCKEIVLGDNYQNMVVPVASNHLTSRYKLAKEILGTFGIEVKPVDKQTDISEPEIDWSIYQKLKLPTLDYVAGMEEIVRDIRKNVSIK